MRSRMSPRSTRTLSLCRYFRSRKNAFSSLLSSKRKVFRLYDSSASATHYQSCRHRRVINTDLALDAASNAVGEITKQNNVLVIEFWEREVRERAWQRLHS